MAGDGLTRGEDQVGWEAVEIVFYQLERQAHGFFLVSFRWLSRVSLLRVQVWPLLMSPEEVFISP